jgi:hypothetical protein
VTRLGKFFVVFPNIKMTIAVLPNPYATVARIQAASRCIDRYHLNRAPPFGVSLAFVAPNLAAPDAPVVWTASGTGGDLMASADRFRSESTWDFELSKLPTARHVVIDGAGFQHVVLRSPGIHVTLHIDGTLIASGPSALTFRSRGVAALSGHSRALSALVRVLNRGLDVRTEKHEWPAEHLEFRNALIALDGKYLGATHQEIATALYSAEHVAREWPDTESAMRYAVKRHLARGRRLMNGGYLALLQKPNGRGA